MRTAFISAFACLVAYGVSAAEFREDTVVHAVGGPEMHFIAQRLALSFDERGMGSFILSRAHRSFAAFAYAGESEPLTSAQRTKETSDRPLTLSYESPYNPAGARAVNTWNRDRQHISIGSVDGGNARLHSTLFLEHGVTMRTIEEHIRRFMLEIDAFEKNLRKQ